MIYYFATKNKLVPVLDSFPYCSYTLAAEKNTW